MVVWTIDSKLIMSELEEKAKVPYMYGYILSLFYTTQVPGGHILHTLQPIKTGPYTLI